MFQAEHCLCSTQDVAWDTKEDIPCVPSRTFLVFQTGHSVCSKQDIPCIRNRTFLVFQTRKMHLPLFGEFCRSSQDFGQSSAIFAQILGRSAKFAKKWCVDFSVFFFPKPSPKHPRRNLRVETSVPKRPRRNAGAETSAPKRLRRNVCAETSASKRPRRNARDAEFSGRNF